jgi:pyridoxal/pyridoxine/pyridoxamine kinase
MQQGPAVCGSQLPPCYRGKNVGLASVMTPNQLEMEQPVGRKASMASSEQEALCWAMIHDICC